MDSVAFLSKVVVIVFCDFLLIDTVGFSEAFEAIVRSIGEVCGNCLVVAALNKAIFSDAGMIACGIVEKFLFSNELAKGIVTSDDGGIASCIEQFFFSNACWMNSGFFENCLALRVSGEVFIEKAPGIAFGISLFDRSTMGIIRGF